MLEQELTFFAAHQSEWAAEHRNQYALVTGETLLGFFDTDIAALTEGARLLGLTSFLVRRIGEQPAPVVAPALTLGLLHATLEPAMGRTIIYTRPAGSE